MADGGTLGHPQTRVDEGQESRNLTGVLGELACAPTGRTAEHQVMEVSRLLGGVHQQWQPVQVSQRSGSPRGAAMLPSRQRPSGSATTRRVLHQRPGHDARPGDDGAQQSDVHVPFTSPSIWSVDTNSRSTKDNLRMFSAARRNISGSALCPVMAYYDPRPRRRRPLGPL